MEKALVVYAPVRRSYLKLQIQQDSISRQPERRWARDGSQSHRAGGEGHRTNALTLYGGHGFDLVKVEIVPQIDCFDFVMPATRRDDFLVLSAEIPA